MINCVEWDHLLLNSITNGIISFWLQIQFSFNSLIFFFFQNKKIVLSLYIYISHQSIFSQNKKTPYKTYLQREPPETSLIWKLPVTNFEFVGNYRLCIALIIPKCHVVSRLSTVTFVLYVKAFVRVTLFFLISVSTITSWA